VHHALETGDQGLALQAIERIVQRRTTWSRLDGATYLGWLEALPEDAVRARPRLALLAARALYVTGQRARAERTLRELEGSLRKDPTGAETGGHAGPMLEQIAADRASYAAMRGDVGHALEWARKTLARLGEGQTLAHVRPASVLGLAAFRCGDVEEAGRAFTRAIAAAQAAGIPFAATPLLCNLADVQVVRGRLDEALQACDRAQEAGTVNGHPTPAVGFAGLVRARVAYARNDLPGAERHAREGLDLLRRGHLTLGMETLYAELARARQAQGNAKGARAAIEQALQVAQGNDVPRLMVQTAAYQARVWLAQGELRRAGRWAGEVSSLEPTQYLREFEDLTLAWVLLARGAADEALARLDRLLAPAQAAGRMGPAIEASALRALALSALGRTDEALQALLRALELAEPAGYVRVFVDQGAPMAGLLLQVSGLTAAYASKLLRAFKAPAPEPTHLKPGILPEPLTPRELEVLHLLAEGLTNPEIARRLVVSLPTVKSHARNLYGKLDVHSRREAVARARRLGLID
jgi:LuxR family maltose regulon positive regulatory protein